MKAHKCKTLGTVDSR